MLTSSSGVTDGVASPTAPPLLPQASQPQQQQQQQLRQWPAVEPAPYTTDSSYSTPLPRMAHERSLWRLLIALYPYTTPLAVLAAAAGELSGPPAATASPALPPAVSVGAGAVGGGCRARLEQAMAQLVEPFTCALAAAVTTTTTTATSGSFLDLILRHPFPPLRHALLESALRYANRLSFDFCGPVAVCASTGDVDALRILHRGGGPGMDPNTGLPLLVAVRHGHCELLRELLAPSPPEDGVLSRLKSNLGSAFAEAVRLGNTAAAALLAARPDVNVNRFATGRGTCALLTACRAFAHASRRVMELETALAQKSVGGASRRSPPPPLESRPLSPSVAVSPHVAAASVPALAAAPAVAAVGGGVRGPTRRSGGRGSPSDGTDTDALGALLGSTTTAPTIGVEQQLQAANHALARWRAMLYLLLSFPSMDVNVGYYRSPLQLAVRCGCVELVSLLVRHPRLRPNRGPRPTAALGQSLVLLHHTTLSPGAMRAVVEVPIATAVRTGDVASFALLLRHRRTGVGGELLELLERDPRDLTSVPFLASLAEARVDGWEGWGWLWRRRCACAAALSGLALFTLNAILAVGFPLEAGSLRWVLLLTYLAALAPTLVGLRRRRYAVPALLADELAARPDAVTAAARISSLPLARVEDGPRPVIAGGVPRRTGVPTATLQLLAQGGHGGLLLGWLSRGGGAVGPRLLGLVLVLAPGVPLVELLALGVVVGSVVRPGPVVDSLGGVSAGARGRGGGSPREDEVRGGRRGQALVRPPLPPSTRKPQPQPLQPSTTAAAADEDDEDDDEDEEEALVEEAGRKVFAHDADTIGDQFPFHLRRAERRRGRGRRGTGEGSRSSFEMPPEVATQGSGVGHKPHAMLPRGLARTGGLTGEAAASGQEGGARPPATAEPASDASVVLARMYVRTLAYLTLELVVPSRLVVCVVAFFTHLVTVFPETGNVHDSAEATAVAALGLLCSVIYGGALMTLWLALRCTSPESVLSGRRRFTDEDGPGCVHQEPQPL